MTERETARRDSAINEPDRDSVMTAPGRDDDATRIRALDVTRSWLVQAPAGSGKTELLIQRFLALLAIVDRPERVVAMTFTRKAAAEMRERILRSLREAANADPSPGRSSHAQATAALAAAARRQIDTKGWGLLEQPSRLRIVTIDALAASLSREAPMTSGLGSMPRVDEGAQLLYEEAVRDCLAGAAASDPDWRCLLAWLDNDVERAVGLLAAMLAARDRWPAHFLAQDADALRAAVETALKAVGERAALEVKTRMPPSLVEEFADSAREASSALASGAVNQRDIRLVDAIRELARTRELPAVGDRRGWAALCGWWLTRDGGLRRKIDRNQGFPAAGKGPGADERARSKRAFGDRIAQAASTPGLEAALMQLRDAPPETFDDEAWQFAAAAMRVLGRCADTLQAVFIRHGAIDFPEQTFRALAALGDPDAPAELLLAIDSRLSHLLVDEFQDTSAAQLALIGRLTAGWERGDGRTLFVVGDPMQSIYRFRKAEVGLFVDAQASATVVGVPVEVGVLARNFRSAPAIVIWVNAVLGNAFPTRSNALRGEVAYAPAIPASALEGETPSVDLVATREDEARIVVKRAREAIGSGAGRIAVLLRSRAHAALILPALRRAGIGYSAVELEGVHDRLATRDLLSLARVLSQPADRLAWFSVLRAPWCALTLADLVAIAGAAPATGDAADLVRLLAQPERWVGVSADGKARLRRLMNALTPVLESGTRHPFSLRLRAAWMALGGPACAESMVDLAGAERLFALIDQRERAGDLDDYDALGAEAETIFAESPEPRSGVVEVMTIHRAKGLEFDCVIIPGCDRAVRRGEPPVLRWRLSGDAGARALVVAPRQRRSGAAGGEDPVYGWLAAEETREERAELMRLVYVAVTRARHRLHLVGAARAAAATNDPAITWTAPPAGTILGAIWGSLGSGDPIPAAVPRPPPPEIPPAAPPPLRRLSLAWLAPEFPASLPAPAVPEAAGEHVRYEWAEVTAAAIGTVAHRVLAQIGQEGLDRWDDARLRRERPRLIAELAAEGVDTDRREAAARQVAEVVARTLSDERGRWLFSPAHADARVEWALAAVEQGAVVHVRIDRSFVAGGVRYIVDFKTGRHEGGDRAAFLARERERYRPQLLRYARIVRALDPLPIRIALFHPLVEGGWQEEPVDALK